jgi:predicted dehydrogenase
MLRVGLIGAGYMMQVVHLPSLRAIGGVELVAIADLDEGLARKVAGAFGIPKTYPSADALIAGEPGLDAVVVVTRKDHHAAACLPALRKGISVLIEKPLEVSIDNASEMVATAERTGAILMIGYMKRYDPAVLELERQLGAGALGDLRYAQLHDFGGNWTYGAPRVGAFQLGEADATPGPIRLPQPPPPDLRTTAYLEWLEVWVHDLNLARALFGEVRSIVFATNEVPRLVVLDCERCRVLLEMANINYPGGAWDETVTIHGSKGRGELVFPAPLLFRKPTGLTIRQSAGVFRPTLADREAFIEEMIHFLDCVRTRQQPRTPGSEGLADLRLCAAIADHAAATAR